MVGFLLALLALLLLPFWVSVELETTRPPVARLSMLGIAAVYRRKANAPRKRRSRPEQGAPGTGAGADDARSGSGGASVGGELRALDELFSTLRREPVRDARIALRGGTGDAATTAVLYGTAWALVSAVMTASGTGAERVELEPRFDGPPVFEASAGARFRAPLWLLVLGGIRAARALRSS